MSGFLFGGLLLIIGIIFGARNERNHFARIQQAEAELSDIKILNIKTLPDNLEKGGALVTGNVVIAVDYFKVFISGFIMLFGCLLYTSPSPRDLSTSRMPSSA